MSLPRAKNISLAGTDFAVCLAALREKRRMTKTDLADKSGLSYRTIHDLEQGRRSRIQEKTLLLLAQALGVTTDTLLAQPVPTTAENATRRPLVSRRLGLGLLIVAAILLLLGASSLWHMARHNAIWTRSEQGTLVVHDAIFGTRLWGFDEAIKVGPCRQSPWRDDRLLVPVIGEVAGGGCLLNLDLATGDTIWVMRPDVGAAVRAFGAEDVLAANFGCRLAEPIDVDGDGSPELAVTFIHRLYYPTLVCLVDQDGGLVSQYALKGHIMESYIGDLDGDGREEFLGIGTNNAKAHQGASAVILDQDHWRGASIDSLCDPWSSEPDSALYRLVLPAYPAPFMELIGANRLHGRHLRISSATDGAVELNFRIGPHPANETGMVVFVDALLQPRSCTPTDGFIATWNAQWPDSIRAGRGPWDAAWREEWLASARHFSAGHWPPRSDQEPAQP